MLTCDEYLMPKTLEEALALWRDAPEGSRIVAGATDLLPWAREGRAGDVHLTRMIDISSIDALGGYEVKAGRVRLGANVPYQSFLTDETLRKQLPCMPYCAIWFADDQIREQATLAGNIVNASPAADGTPPVLAMHGSVEVARLDGDKIVTRTEPVTEFVKGPGKTTLQPGEIVTAVEVDATPGYGGAFEKVGQRRSLVISVVCAACLVKPSEDGATFEDVRIAMGGIGPVPIRLAEVEAFLKGREISGDVIRAAARKVDGLVNSRSRREYRRDVVEGFIQRAVEDALSDCGAALPSANVRELTDA